MRQLLFLFITILATALSAATPKPGDADYPALSPSARHTEKVAAVKAGNYDLVLIGDSITHTIGELGGKYEPLKAVWEKHFAPRHAINLGHNGYRTENILWNLENGELDFARSPKVAMLLIGTNNADDRHFSRRSYPRGDLRGHQSHRRTHPQAPPNHQDSRAAHFSARRGHRKSGQPSGLQFIGQVHRDLSPRR